MPSKPPGHSTSKSSERLAALQTAATNAFPNIFDPNDPKPLAVGVHRQLKAALEDISMTQIRAFLRHWTRRPAYLKAISNGTERLDLNENKTESIDPDHQRQAKEALDQQRQKRAAAKPKPARRQGHSRGPANRHQGRGNDQRRHSGGGQRASNRSDSPSHGPRIRDSAPKTKPVIVVKKRRHVSSPA